MISSLAGRWLALPPNLRGILWVGLSGVLFSVLNVLTDPDVMSDLMKNLGGMNVM